LSEKRAGFSRERELARLLWKKGFAVIRAPASGAKAKRVNYPDIVALRKGSIFVIEVKTRGKVKPIYIDEWKIERLLEFCRRSFGRGYIAVKYVEWNKWFFIPIELLEKTPGGNYKVSSESLEKALTIEDLINISDGVKPLSTYISK